MDKVSKGDRGDTSPAMMFIVDESDERHLVRDCNEAVTERLGFSRESLAGTPLSGIMVERASGAHEFRRADGGSLRAVTVASQTVTDDGERFATLVAVPLPTAIDPEYSAKLSALGDLAHHVVHELNQPLSVIRMALGTARRKLRTSAEVDIPFLEAKLDRMDAQCMRAAAIAETMRIFMPRDRQLKVSLDVDRAMENALSMSAPLFRKRNVVVDTIPGPACHVEGNEMHLEPVLLCILGEVHDRIERLSADTPPTVKLEKRLLDGGELEISIRDNAGIPDEGIVDERIGSPVSMGLGVALAMELVGELHGRFEREAGPEGMTYRIVLPTVDAPETAEADGVD